MRALDTHPWRSSTLPALLLAFAPSVVALGACAGAPGAPAGAPAAPEEDREPASQAAGDPACAPRTDARVEGDCDAIVAVVWDGQACEERSGCGCVGPDCGHWTSARECHAAHEACPGLRSFPCRTAWCRVGVEACLEHPQGGRCFATAEQLPTCAALGTLPSACEERHGVVRAQVSALVDCGGLAYCVPGREVCVPDAQPIPECRPTR